MHKNRTLLSIFPFEPRSRPYHAPVPCTPRSLMAGDAYEHMQIQSTATDSGPLSIASTIHCATRHRRCSYRFIKLIEPNYLSGMNTDDWHQWRRIHNLFNKTNSSHVYVTHKFIHITHQLLAFDTVCCRAKLGSLCAPIPSTVRQTVPNISTIRPRRGPPRDDAPRSRFRAQEGIARAQ